MLVDVNHIKQTELAFSRHYMPRTTVSDDTNQWDFVSTAMVSQPMTLLTTVS